MSESVRSKSCNSCGRTEIQLDPAWYARTMTAPNPSAGLPEIDTHEYGGKKDGVRQSMDRRLFMQLVVCDTVDADAARDELVSGLRASGTPGVVYADTANPRGVGLLTWGEDPSRFVRDVRPLFSKGSLREARMRDDFSMMGRTYASGHEPDLEHWLLKRSVERVMDESCPWHVWYPLRRSGAFARLPAEEVLALMREHAAIGHAYGQKGLAHDVRLACQALDAHDNDFVIGLIGKELFPLSHLVAAMRKTRQTSEFITQMGPFFVGYATARVT